MPKLAKTLQIYLDRIDRLGAGMGSEPERPERPVTREDSLFLTELLLRQIGRADYLIVLALVVLFVSYAVAVFVVLYLRNDSLAIKGAFAGLLVFTLATVRALRGIWNQKTVMNVLIVMLRELSPRDAAEFIDVLYWKMLTSSRQTKSDGNNRKD
jgi:hypothetical protein